MFNWVFMRHVSKSLSSKDLMKASKERIFPKVDN